MSILHKNFKWYFLGAVAVAVTLVWVAIFQVEAGRGVLTVDFFDVGQGDSTFIQTPSGNQLLVDGGPDGTVLSRLGAAMPFWDRSIDVLVLTHPHADHLDGAFEVLKRYRVDTVVEAGVNHSLPEYDEWHRLLKEKNVSIHIAKAGERIDFGDGVQFDIYSPAESFIDASPKNIHDAMITGRLVYGSSSILMMGDAEKAIEYELIFRSYEIPFIVLNSDVLKTGHHGSKTSSMEEFLKVVSPKFAVISVGAKNRYGHPNQEVLDRLNLFGIKIFRTDRDKTIKMRSDGKAIGIY